MFDHNRWHKELADQLAKRGEDIASLNGKTRLLFQVELGLRLLEFLDLRDEPITVLWVVLSGLPIPHYKLQSLTQAARRAVAVARVLLPFSSRFNWEDALRAYAQIPEGWRCYDIKPTELDQQLVANIRISNRREEHIHAYEQILSQTPPDSQALRGIAEAGEVGMSVFLRGGGKEHLRVSLSQNVIDQIQSAPNQTYSFQRPRQRGPISITYTELEEVARLVDMRLAQKGKEGDWLNRVREHIHYRALTNDVPQELNSIPLNIDGMAHVVGMVGSGKSTLMKMIAAHIVLNERDPKRHITLIVGSTMLALELAHDLNEFLADGDVPVAVPILGRTERERHLREFNDSKLSTTSHWILRWLNTACPLMGLAPIDQIANLPNSILPGREPCESLEAINSKGEVVSRKLCPFFHACPSHQTYRDMVNAQIWITTPGGLSSSRIPLHVDRRGLKLGELVYEHSDVMIVDEADTVVEWFDNQYAQEIPLRGRPDAIFDLADRLAAQARTERVLQFDEERWARAESIAAFTTNNLLRILSHSVHSKLLRDWIGSRYFTAFTLFERLARRLCGLQDWSPEDDVYMDDSTRQMLEHIRGYFDEILDRDPFTQRYPPGSPEERLVTLLNGALREGIEPILEDCRDWIERFVPDIDGNLAQLNAQFVATSRPQETKETLALRFAFAVNVAVLDYSLRIVFYEWYSQPEEVTDELDIQPYRPVRLSFSEILPIPPIGRVFGTYYANNPESEDEDEGVRDILSRFEYSNIGRWYILNYHQLLEPFGLPGPNVLLMSATSWLPDSTRLHVDIPPQGVLEPNSDHIAAISDESSFEFLPQTYPDTNAIVISGEPKKLAALRAMAESLSRKGLLWDEYSRLTRLATENSRLWGDRARLLLVVNSYEQAKTVAEVLSRTWSAGNDKVFFLRRNQEWRGEDLVYFRDGSIQRSDIETFADTPGHILVAPLNAIGRGYNILNSENKVAAFGSIYFLIRPMPHPFDVQAVAAELNSRTFDWCNDAALEAWKEAPLVKKGTEFRRHAKRYWRRAELRRGYRNLARPGDFMGPYNARRDLAATTLGQIIQACGRLVRGGVPFHAYFVDGIWAPNSVRWHVDGDPLDAPEDSLLTAMVMLLAEYVDEYDLGKLLYKPFEGLIDMPGFHPDLGLHYGGEQ